MDIHICGTDGQGRNGCGAKWFTLEMPEGDLEISFRP